MQKLDKLLTGIENFFAGLRCSPLPADGAAHETFPDHATAAVVSCRIAENDAGGWSIYLGKTRNVKIGNYASYADASRVAKKYNFFEVIEETKN